MEGPARGNEHERRDGEAVRRALSRVRAAALHRGVEPDMVEDCGMDFIYKRLLKVGMKGLQALANDDERLNRAADLHARRYAYRLRRHRKIELSIDGEGAAEAERLACKEPGPEEQVISAEVMDDIAAACLQLTDDQREILIRRFLYQAPYELLGAEIGRTTHATEQAALRIRKRLQHLLAERGIDADEAAAYLNMMEIARE